ncbi:uncharacterized protein EURHEDRAFT_412785 [Aspergillus ruber CBS 135680]|uniref:Uncharacterized protein n=1 Tax=Aspergillus ruber (strain CBS 135680) TaxID=1388766 RepID=A0A017SE69_ASPRC|nr:uncharacterized protein EURHEDRAFT_412785 [Aspergillus ruber CBS 135680]EYE94934.1 hypothetical protein EURHEDRAFT_412785 [Aspergillus ruber CBS 135680]
MPKRTMQQMKCVKSRWLLELHQDPMAKDSINMTTLLLSSFIVFLFNIFSLPIWALCICDVI